VAKYVTESSAISISGAPRSEVSCRRFGHQCIEAEGASTESYHEEHTAHHREVPKEGVSVTARCRGVTYDPIGMENQRKRKRVKEKGESLPIGRKARSPKSDHRPVQARGRPNRWPSAR
jgi:hypothetical protein